MQLQHHKENDIDFIKLPRRILMADAKATQKSLRRYLNRKQPRLALDMSETEFVDSSGLAVLVNCLQASRRNSGEVCLFEMQDQVQALFELTRLHTVFPIEQRRRDAVRRLTASAERGA